MNDEENIELEDRYREMKELYAKFKSDQERSDRIWKIVKPLCIFMIIVLGAAFITGVIMILNR